MSSQKRRSAIKKIMATSGAVLLGNIMKGSIGQTKTIEKNDFGLFDMTGNVWEWTSDLYNTQYFGQLKAKNMVVLNPIGATSAYNPSYPNTSERAIKGISYLCSSSYCASYRLSFRITTAEDSSMEHLRFRTVLSPKMRKEDNTP